MNQTKEFLAPRLTPWNIDLFLVRKSILKALQATLPKLSGTLLDVGCGYMPYKPLLVSEQSAVKKYIGLDLANNLYQKPDLEWDGKTITLAENTIESAIATEVLEHCPEPELVLREILRVLKPGGIFFFTVPFLWNLHDIPYDEYRYTPFSLERHLKNAGFEEIEIQALGGWDASLAQMLGLWTRRRLRFSLMQKLMRPLVALLLLPIIWFLIKLDQPPKEFKSAVMITGLYGIARKPEVT